MNYSITIFSEKDIVLILPIGQNNAMFNVYVDADSFPATLMNIVLKRLVKESRFIGEAVFVSDRVIPSVRETIENHTHLLREENGSTLDKAERRKIRSNIRYIVVPSGTDSADNMIFSIASLPGFAITHDVPLSYRLTTKGLSVIDDRGHIYTEENVRARLSERNINTSLREWGIFSEKTRPLTPGDINTFSASFDSLINQMKKGRPETT